MLPVFIEFFFIMLLIAILVMLVKTERINLKKLIPQARIEEYWDGKERRHQLRFNKALEVNYKIEKRPHLRRGKTVNISEGGLKLVLDDKLAKGTILNLSIAIPNSKGSAEVEGEVVWCEDANINDDSGKRFFYSGIKFFAIKEVSGLRLIDYIRSLPSESKT